MTENSSSTSPLSTAVSYGFAGALIALGLALLIPLAVLFLNMLWNLAPELDETGLTWFELYLYFAGILAVFIPVSFAVEFMRGLGWGYAGTNSSRLRHFAFLFFPVFFSGLFAIAFLYFTSQSPVGMTDDNVQIAAFLFVFLSIVSTFGIFSEFRKARRKIAHQ